MMTTRQVSEDAKAILMLCGRFGDQAATNVTPLSIREYDELATWLHSEEWRPGDLLDADNVSTLDEALAPIPVERLKTLLARGAAMTFAIEKWTNKGLWVLCRSDDEYPQRLKQHLRRAAPPILYGAGELGLLSKGGVAVVGSRNIDDEAQQFAADIGRCAAESGMQVVSGAARGVDELAMQGAFNAEGTVVGVMANSLLKAAVSGKYRQGIRDGRLLLVSPYNPESAFNVGNAMQRNKYIYALADYAIVVNSDFEKGGTWNGAVEELKRDGGRTVFVRTGNNVPRGNNELIKLGAQELPTNGLVSNLREACEEVVTGRTAPVKKSIQETSAAADQTSSTGARQSSNESDKSVAEGSPDETPRTILDVVRPHILKALARPQNAEELAKLLGVRKAQAIDWLKTLLHEETIEQRTVDRKKKYVVRKHQEQLDLH